VINLELPWTPLRLEQRAGRVDRIGQRRVVHAVRLVARGTGEEDVMTRLAARSDRARASLEAGSVTLRAAAECEAKRLHGNRALLQRAAASLDGRPALCTFRRRRGGAAGRFWAWTFSCVDAADRVLWDGIVGLSGPAARPLTPLLPEPEALTDLIAAQVQTRLAHLARDLDPYVTLMERRERAILRGVDERRARLATALVQAGLFDRRAERDSAAQQALLHDVAGRCAARLRDLAATRRARVDECRLVFAVTLT
jgi:hypothetical protein